MQRISALHVTIWVCLALSTWSTLGASSPVAGADGSPSEAAAPWRLLAPETVKDGRKDERGPTVWQVEIDPSVMTTTAPSLTFHLPTGDVTAPRTHAESRPDGRVWRGRVGDHSTTLTLHDGLLAGRIETVDGDYEIRPTAERSHRLVRLDRSALPPLGEPLIPPPYDPGSDEVGESGEADELAKMASVVTVLVVYSAEARAEAGGTAQIEARIANAMDGANTALANSRVSSRYQLVHAAELPLANTFEPDLEDLRADSRVTSLRDAWRADLVAAIYGGNLRYCGLGYLMNRPGGGFAPWAYSWSVLNCLAFYVLPHEMGHNLGLDHDPANGSPPSEASFPWSFGHFVDGSYSTVMSYSSACTQGCPERPYYSNPAVSFAGQPTGIDGRRDNARSLRSTMPIGAGFRTGTSAPDAPANLRATAVDVDAVQLRWEDRSFNESAFELERRVADGSFEAVASLGAGTTAYRDESLASGTSYGYRVRARNAGGVSDWSNAVTVTTAGGSPPTDLTVTVLSSSSVRLDWQDGTDGELGYDVEAATFDGFAPVADAPADATSLVVDGLLSEVAYRFRIRARLPDGSVSTFTQADAVVLPQAAPFTCVADATSTCLNRGRFQVSVHWRNGSGLGDVGRVVPGGTQDSSLFWFFGADNWEMLVKVLDGCAFNDRFWVYAAATTDVEYTLRIVDSETGAAATYFNPQGSAAAAVTDIDALSVCAGSP